MKCTHTHTHTNTQLTNITNVTEVKGKEVNIVFPPAEKNDRPTAYKLSLVDNVELRDFVSIHRGNLMDRCDGIKIRYQQLEDDGVYTLFGPGFMALENDVRTWKVSKKMEEIGALVAVKKQLESKCTLHLNVSIYGNHNNEILVENIVKDEKSEACRAFICDFAKQPSDDDIKVVRDKADKFALLAKLHEPFQSVTQVIPVLAGRSWHPDIATGAANAQVWRVQTSGGRYQVTRSFSTAVRAVRKFV